MNKVLAVALLLGCAGAGYTLYDNFRTVDQQFGSEQTMNRLSLSQNQGDIQESDLSEDRLLLPGRYGWRRGQARWIGWQHYQSHRTQTFWRVYWHNDKGTNDGVQTSRLFSTQYSAEQFYKNLGVLYAKIMVHGNHVIQNYGQSIWTKKCEQAAYRDHTLTKTEAPTSKHIVQYPKWRVFWHNNMGHDDGVQKSKEFNTQGEALSFYTRLGWAFAKIIVSEKKVIKHYGDSIHTKKCKQIAERDGYLVLHDLISKKKYCGHHSTPEKQIKTLNECQAHCKAVNTHHNIKGYWWKPWGGGYCGCCTDVDHLTTNWPDVSVYRMSPFGFSKSHVSHVVKTRETPLDFCSIKEYENKMGAYRCASSKDCKGKRTCNRDGWCEGNDRCDKFHPCHIDESFLSKKACVHDSECRGSRTCEHGTCNGESGCPSEKQCEVREEFNKKGKYRCKYDFECGGLRTCSTWGWCEGESGCKQQNFCNVNESKNPLGSGKCSIHRHCKGKRTCSKYGGYCTGRDSCCKFLFEKSV